MRKVYKGEGSYNIVIKMEVNKIIVTKKNLDKVNDYLRERQRAQGCGCDHSQDTPTTPRCDCSWCNGGCLGYHDD